MRGLVEYSADVVHEWRTACTHTSIQDIENVCAKECMYIDRQRWELACMRVHVIRVPLVELLCGRISRLGLYMQMIACEWGPSVVGAHGMH